ncbi:MAG: ABC transporter ATP-binding protein [Fimbriimonadaceae bacterium]|nr:ABC transporter ATP-binding protein [Chthonomonadaceae bacterium]MCO5297358.1 ABC transporter ATP-binding protein [Fimbriimonadaceae bacterium]
MIEARELRKTYGSTIAVDGVSFDVAPGETFGLLGPNGAGKTTTIQMLVGALDPDSGSARIDGKAATDREARLEVGISPQSVALYDDLTAEENLRFYGAMYALKGPRLKERVDWCLAFAGLEDRRNDRVGTFSGGMKRRLNMAVALVHEPRLVLFDEPTVGVDPQSRNHIFESVEALSKAGLTVLYTTHYMEEAERLCDRVAIMDRGKVLALDTVAGLVEAHGGMSTIVADLTAPPAQGVTLPGELEGLTLRVNTRRPLEDLAAIATSQVGLASLSLDRADLETVFLNLTGRSLRD